MRTAPESFDRVYASTTFTSLEEHSHLASHQRDFDIKAQDGREAHHLYWESGRDHDYPVRLNRYERFRRLATELGLDAYKGVNGT